MLCLQSRKLLVPYVEGALDEKARSMVEKHLAACAACRMELECVKSVSAALRSDEVPAAEPSPDLWARVKQRIESQPVSKHRAPVPQAAFALAGIAFAAFLGWGILRTQMGPEMPGQAARAPLLSQGEAPESAAALPEEGADSQERFRADHPAKAPKKQTAGSPNVSNNAKPTLMAKSAPDDFPTPVHISPDVKVVSPGPAAAPPAPADGSKDAPIHEKHKSDKADVSALSAYDHSAGAKSADVASPPPASSRVGIVAESKNLSAIEYLNTANSQMAAGDKTNAAANYYNALAAGKPTQWTAIANDAKQSGALDLVTANARESFSANQDSKSGLILYELQSVQKDRTGRLDTAKRLVTLDSESPLHWLKLGEAYESAGNTTKAIESYSKAAAGSDPQVASTARARLRRLRGSSAPGQQ